MNIIIIKANYRFTGLYIFQGFGPYKLSENLGCKSKPNLLLEMGDQILLIPQNDIDLISRDNKIVNICPGLYIIIKLL